MTSRDLRDWDTPGVAEQARKEIRLSIDKMSRTPGSGIAMCHSQGKTAVYVSEDGTQLVEHAPDGTITTKPYGTK